MDTLYTFWDNITHYKTESVHFWGLLNSATRELTSAPEALDPKPAKIAKPYSGNPEEPLLVQIHQPTLRTPKTGIRECPYILTRMYATKTHIVRVSRVGRPFIHPDTHPRLEKNKRASARQHRWGRPGFWQPSCPAFDRRLLSVSGSRACRLGIGGWWFRRLGVGFRD